MGVGRGCGVAVGVGVRVGVDVTVGNGVSLGVSEYVGAVVAVGACVAGNGVAVGCAVSVGVADAVGVTVEVQNISRRCPAMPSGPETAPIRSTASSCPAEIWCASSVTTRTAVTAIKPPTNHRARPSLRAVRSEFSIYNLFDDDTEGDRPCQRP